MTLDEQIRAMVEIVTDTQNIAQIIGTHPAICETSTIRAEALATAQLFSAAPELYAALEELTNAVDALIADRPMLAAKIAGSTTLGNVRAFARAAIGKAVPHG